MPKVSVIVAVCDLDCEHHFCEFLDSMKSQTFENFEIIITFDGPAKNIEKKLTDYIKINQHPIIKFYKIDTSRGPAQCWNNGIDFANSQYLLRMDPDDLARPDYIQSQVSFMENNLTVDVAGAHIEEFNLIPGDINRQRIVPLNHTDIENSMKFKNSMNHVTVIMRRSSIGELRYEQFSGFVDYLFWLNLISKKLVFSNNDKILVDVRVGNNFLMRRRGYKYALKEIKFVVTCLERGYFNYFNSFRYILTKPLVRLLPSFLLAPIYSIYRRKNK